MSLVERERELEQIESLLTAARAGEGAALLVEGVAGIGKTSLLDVACELAAERGMRVLRARAGALEREIGFGVARQLLVPLLAGVGERERRELLGGAAGNAAGPLGLGGHDVDASRLSPGAELHGLYWLCANACEAGPLALAIDDLHWADEASLRLIAYLARRASEHPLAIIAATRPADAGTPVAQALEGVWQQALRPAPLSGHAVESLVRAELGANAESEFCATCAGATAGNPFLLTAMIAALRAEGVAPVAEEVGRIDAIGSETLTRAVMARICRVGPDAVAVARALAVLGGDAVLRRVARLAELPPDAAGAALDRLRREGVVAGERLELVHPLVRTAIESDLAEPAHELAQLRAARLLRDESEQPGRIAAHLLTAEVTGQRWVVQTLRAAAAAALAGGAPESAVALLRRALAEPPGADERAPLLAELGGALARAGEEQEAIRTLIEAAELTQDPIERARVALAMGPPVQAGAFHPKLLAALEQARQLLGERDRDLAAHLAVMIATARNGLCEPVDALVEPVEAALQAASSPAARAACLSSLAFAAAGTGARPAEEVVRLAGEGAEHARSIGEARSVPMATAAMAIAGRPSAALPLLDEAIETASGVGDPTMFTVFSLYRARTHLLAGSAVPAEADAWAALAASAQPAGGVAFALGVLLLTLVARGRYERAERELAAHGLTDARALDRFQDYLLLQSRGMLRLAEGRAAEALADCMALGEWLTAAGFTNPAFAEWRSLAARAHLALGEPDSARRLAAEEEHLARDFGAPPAVGIALRTRGLIEGGERGLALLSESVSTLEGSQARLGLTRSLVEHGAALRRSGHRRDAREVLRRGLGLAQRCGAVPLAERARDELRAAGGRPRRESLSGPRSLTASELRVARLAAAGRSNREIAQSLFVTRRTVEVHLTSTYRKLAIDSREQLSAALEH